MQRLAAFLLITIALLALGSCSGEKETPLQATEKFFQLTTTGKTTEAYESTAFAFQAQQGEKAFGTRVTELALNGATYVVTQESADEKTAKLNAQILTKTGTKLTLIVTMQRDGKQWRLFSLNSPRSKETGVFENRFSIVGKAVGFNESATQKMPEKAALMHLVKESMKQFSDAVQTRSFTDFYNFTAAAWQAQLTEKQLARAFQAFTEREVDLTGLAQLEPTFDTPPMIGTDGLLIISGDYPTRPYQVSFSLKFVYELPQWRLFGLDVYLRKANDEPTTQIPKGVKPEAIPTGTLQLTPPAQGQPTD